MPMIRPADAPVNATDDAWSAYDDEVWSLGADPDLGPEPDDAGPLVLSLSELAEWEAAKYRGWGNAAGDLFASRMAALAAQIRLCDADDPETFVDRRDALLRDAMAEARKRLAPAGL